MEHPDPAKQALYDAICMVGEKNIQRGILAGQSRRVICEIISCATKEPPVRTAALLTSLLHYLLAITLVPSQRKVCAQGTQVDIVIPGLAALKKDPRNAILICIPDLHDSDIGQQIESMRALQPHRQNIWYVTERSLDEKTYSLGDGTFPGILDDILGSAASAGSKFRFLA